MIERRGMERRIPLSCVRWNPTARGWRWKMERPRVQPPRERFGGFWSPAVRVSVAFHGADNRQVSRIVMCWTVSRPSGPVPRFLATRWYPPFAFHLHRSCWMSRAFSSPRASVVRMAWLKPSLRGLELRCQDSLCPRDRDPRGFVNEHPWEAPCQLLQACIRFRPFTTLGPWLSFRVIPSFLDRNQGVLRNPFFPFKRIPFERAGRSLSQRDVWGKRPIRRHHNGHGRDGDAQWRTFAASQRPQRTRDARESGQDGRRTSSGGGGGQWSRRTGVPSCT